MIQYNKRCKVCQAVKRKNSELAKRIYRSKAYQRGGESLLAIWRDYQDQFLYISLTNHVKKHQNLTEELLADAKIQQIADDVKKDKIRQMVTHQDLRKGIMEVAQEMLQKGELKGISASTALRAAKDDSDIEERNKDRSLEVFKMMAAFQSGELKREDEDGYITAPAPGSLIEGS